ALAYFVRPMLPANGTSSLILVVQGLSIAFLYLRGERWLGFAAPQFGGACISRYALLPLGFDELSWVATGLAFDAGNVSMGNRRPGSHPPLARPANAAADGTSLVLAIEPTRITSSGRAGEPCSSTSSVRHPEAGSGELRACPTGIPGWGWSMAHERRRAPRAHVLAQAGDDDVSLSAVIQRERKGPWGDRGIHNQFQFATPSGDVAVAVGYDVHRADDPNRGPSVFVCNLATNAFDDIFLF
ncbi:MAG: hypothetical protein ACREHD_04680, partial [Pirellulales bacterium]